MSHDPARTPNTNFPNLSPANHRIIGPATHRYNCIAWAGHDTEHWWEPGSHYFWPVPASESECSVADLVAAFATLGFETCDAGNLEEHFAIYAYEVSECTHAARQLPTGCWTSKLGPWELIEHHTPQDVAGGVYGNIFQFMKRSLPTN